MHQHPGILSTNLDAECKRATPLTFHQKLFAGAHVPDIVSTSAGAELNTKKKGDVIAELTTTCRELDEVIHISTIRKLKLEETIQILKMNAATTTADEEPEEEVSRSGTQCSSGLGSEEEGHAGSGERGESASSLKH